MINPGDLRWWDDERSGDELASCVLNAAHHVDYNTTTRQQAILEAFALYGQSHNAGVEVVIPLTERHGVNLIAGAVETLVAEVSQTETSPVVSTVNGDWGERRRAKKLTAHVDAKFEEHEVQGLLRRGVTDAIVAGLGTLRPYVRAGEVQYERIHPLNVLVDDRACVDTMPRELYLRRALDRRHMQALYPEHKIALESAQGPQDTFWNPLDSSVDVIEVIECWHLATARGEDDGRHVIATSTCVLLDESYDDTNYPLAFIRATEPSAGFWGSSLVQRSAPAQLRHNKVSRRIDESEHLVAVPRVFVERGANIQKAHLSNDIGAIIEFTGTPPIFMTPTAASPEMYQRQDKLEGKVFESMGVSQLSAQSAKPAGLNSGIAIRSYRDFQSRRFINLERSLERAACRLAFLTIVLEKQLAEDSDEPYRVPYVMRGATDLIEWSKIDLPADRLRVQVLASSALPKDAWGRLQMLQEMLDAGILTQELFWQLADMPDFESARAEAVAADECIRMVLDRMLDGGDYMPPEPYIDFARAIQLATRALQQAEVEGAPESRLALLRQWIPDVVDLQQRAMATAAAEAPPMTPPGMPPVDPSATPPVDPAAALGGPMPAGPEPMPPGMPPGPAPPAPM